MQLRSVLGMLLQSSEPWRNQMKYPEHQQQQGDLTWVFQNTWIDRGLQVEYIWFIYYDFIIFSFLTDCPMLRYLCVFQRYSERAYHICFLLHFSLQEARWMLPKQACFALGSVKAVGHPLCWEHWLNTGPLGLEVRVRVNLIQCW